MTISYNSKGICMGSGVGAGEGGEGGEGAGTKYHHMHMNVKSDMTPVVIIQFMEVFFRSI